MEITVAVKLCSGDKDPGVSIQAQEGRAGAPHVGAAGEPAGADGAAGGAHEAAEGETTCCQEEAPPGHRAELKHRHAAIIKQCSRSLKFSLKL